jgi:tRNA splicing endonuclease
MLDLVGKGRLARNVGKVLVVAWIGDEGKVEVNTVNGMDWTGWS